MKVVIFGGTGQVGTLLSKSFRARGAHVVVVGRKAGDQVVGWDACTLDVRPGEPSWVDAVDGSDVVINLAGRSVDCRYTEANLKAMLDSRVLSTRAVGLAIGAAKRPPAVWLQMGTATIYAHTFDRDQDEQSGTIGGDETGVPAYWKRSIEIAQAWERELESADTPGTRKVCMRTAMVMSPSPGGVFSVLAKMTRARLGGALAGGHQYMSWIHGDDFLGAVDSLIEHHELSGAVNLCAPHPLPQAKFMEHLRGALGVGFGLPATRWMLELGAFVLRTDTELLLKSRRVVPGRLVDAGFRFRFPGWAEAAADLGGNG